MASPVRAQASIRGIGPVRTIAIDDDTKSGIRLLAETDGKAMSVYLRGLILRELQGRGLAQLIPGLGQRGTDDVVTGMSTKLDKVVAEVGAIGTMASAFLAGLGGKAPSQEEWDKIHDSWLKVLTNKGLGRRQRRLVAGAKSIRRHDQSETLKGLPES